MLDDDVPTDPTAPAERRRPGPVARLSREKIARAALEVGFADLTLASVADRLGAAPGALYRYVTDRDDLVAAAVDLAFAPLPQPAERSWRSLLEAEAWLRWQMLHRHPGMVQAVRSLASPPPAVLDRYGTGLSALAGLGFAPADALLALDSVVDLVNDSAEQLGASHNVDPSAAFDAWAEATSPEFASEITSTFADPEAFFHRKLEVVLAGLATTLRSSTLRPSTLRPPDQS